MEAACYTFNYLLKFRPAAIIAGTAYSAAGPMPDCTQIFVAGAKIRSDHHQSP
jgi:hypothetical protein